MTTSRRRKPLLGGRGILGIQEVAHQLRVRADDLAALVEREELSGGVTTEAGVAWGLFEDDLPSRDRLLDLGVRPVVDGTPENYVAPGPPGPSTSWEIRW